MRLFRWLYRFLTFKDLTDPQPQTGISSTQAKPHLFDPPILQSEQSMPSSSVPADALDVDVDEDDHSEEEILSQIHKTDNLETLWDLYNETPQDCEAERVALEKIEKICEAQLQSAGTFVACLEIFEQAPEGANVDRASLEKALSFATMLEECDAADEADEEDLFTHEIDQKRDEVTLLVLKVTSDIKKCWEIFRDTRDEEVEDIALERILALANTREICMEVKEECGYNEDLETRAMVKAAELSNSVDECAEIWEEYGFDSPAGRAAIVRAAEIIKIEDGEKQISLSTGHSELQDVVVSE